MPTATTLLTCSPEELKNLITEGVRSALPAVLQEAAVTTPVGYMKRIDLARHLGIKASTIDVVLASALTAGIRPLLLPGSSTRLWPVEAVVAHLRSKQ